MMQGERRSQLFLNGRVHLTPVIGSHAMHIMNIWFRRNCKNIHWAFKIPKVTKLPLWPITKVRFPCALCRAASRRFFGSDHQNYVGAQSLLESRRIRNLPIFVDLNLRNPVREKLIWLFTWQWFLYKIPDTSKLHLCSVFDIMFWCQFTSDLIYKATMRTHFRNHPLPNSHLNGGVQQGLWGAKAGAPQLRSMHPWQVILLKLAPFSRLTRKRQVFILTFSSRQESNGANAMGWLSILISALGHLALHPLHAQPELIVHLLSALSQALLALSVLHTLFAASSSISHFCVLR